MRNGPRLGQRKSRTFGQFAALIQRKGRKLHGHSNLRATSSEVEGSYSSRLAPFNDAVKHSVLPLHGYFDENDCCRYIDRISRSLEIHHLYTPRTRVFTTRTYSVLYFSTLRFPKLPLSSTLLSTDTFGNSTALYPRLDSLSLQHLLNNLQLTVFLAGNNVVGSIIVMLILSVYKIFKPRSRSTADNPAKIRSQELTFKLNSTRTISTLMFMRFLDCMLTSSYRLLARYTKCAIKQVRTKKTSPCRFLFLRWYLFGCCSASVLHKWYILICLFT